MKDDRTIIKPARWTLASAVMMLRHAAELESAALLAVNDGRPVEEMTIAELRAFIEVHEMGRPGAEP